MHSNSQRQYHNLGENETIHPINHAREIYMATKNIACPIEASFQKTCAGVNHTEFESQEISAWSPNTHPALKPTN